MDKQKEIETHRSVNSFTKKILAIITILICIGYILNPGAGFFEILPDNLPFIGNLDEAGATVLLIKCISILRDK